MSKQNRVSGVGKLPPQDEDIEKQVLGIVITKNDLYYNVSGIIKEDTFYFPNNMILWETITELVAASRPIDGFTILSRLRDQRKISDTLNKDFIKEFTDNVFDIDKLEDYARYLEQKAVARRQINICTETIQRLFAQEDDVFEVMADHDLKSLNAKSSLFSYKDPTADHIGQQALKAVEDGMARGGLMGVPSGLESLDKITGGFMGGDITTIAARTRMGKSALAAVFTYNAAVFGCPSIIFSMEMTAIQLFNRLAAIRIRENHPKDPNGIPYSRINRAELTAEEFLIYKQANEDVRQLPILIDDTSGLSLLGLKSKLVKYIKEHGIKIAFFDYVQIASLSGKGNRADDITELMAGIKTLAKDLNIPIVPLSQIDRASEKRPGFNSFRPSLSDMKGSGGIEEGSDIVLIATRPEVLGVTEYEDGTSTAGIMEINIAKHKNGETGTLKEFFDVATNYFGAFPAEIFGEDLTPNFQPEKPPGNYWQSKRNNDNQDDDPPF